MEMWDVQALAILHTECNAAACYALCHIVSHTLAWLKIPLREAEVQPLATHQSRQQLLLHPILVLPAVGHKDVIEEPLTLTLPTPQILKPRPE